MKTVFNALLFPWIIFYRKVTDRRGGSGHIGVFLDGIAGPTAAVTILLEIAAACLLIAFFQWWLS